MSFPDMPLFLGLIPHSAPPLCDRARWVHTAMGIMSHVSDGMTIGWSYGEFAQAAHRRDYSHADAKAIAEWMNDRESYYTNVPEPKPSYAEAVDSVYTYHVVEEGSGEPANEWWPVSHLLNTESEAYDAMRHLRGAHLNRTYRVGMYVRLRLRP